MHKSCTFDFWHDDTTGASIHDQVFYSTNFYTTRAIEILASHTAHAPADQSLWVHLMFQGVHSPYVDSPSWEWVENNTQSNAFWQPHPFGNMLRAVDTGIGNITRAISDVSGLWDETLIICTSDNGGIGPGNNCASPPPPPRASPSSSLPGRFLTPLAQTPCEATRQPRGRAA